MAKRNKSALKANRQNIKRREHNRALRAKLRTGLKSIRKNLDVKNVEGAKKALQSLQSLVDNMATKGAYSFPGITELPSFYFHRQIYLTFMDDKRGVAMRHEIGVENIMWSTDFPHPACTWPNSRAIVDDLMDGVPADEAYLMVYGNAARVLNV